jgi:uncharacterized protein YcbX
MASSTRPGAVVVSLWRYPVKSMMGEELNAAQVTESGLLGDRAYALIDESDGKVATAKNPRKWPQLFDFRAALAEAPANRAGLAPVRISLPDGTIVSSDQSDASEILSRALVRRVKLASVDRQEVPRDATSEEYWLDMEGFDHRDTVTEFGLPEHTFFDCAVVHVLTTDTLDRFRKLYPEGRWETRRFRPNIVVNVGSTADDFVEIAWIDHVLEIGDEVRLKVTGPCSRCVMTTLSQGDLPNDAGILRTAAKHNNAEIGVYASVLRGGKVRRGDPVTLQ